MSADTADLAPLPPALGAHVAVARPTDPIAAALLHDPLGEIAVEVFARGERARADGLFGPAGYVLATDAAGEALMTGTISRLPMQLALLVGLGPRPAGEATVVAYGDPEDLSGAMDSASMPPEVAAIAGADAAVRWSARAGWIAPDGPAERLVAVIDGADAGLLLCAPGDGVALITARAADVWRALCELLPYPDEVQQG